MSQGDYIDEIHQRLSEFAEEFIDDENERAEFVDTILERRGYQRATRWLPPEQPPGGGRKPLIGGSGGGKGSGSSGGKGGQGGGRGSYFGSGGGGR